MDIQSLIKCYLQDRHSEALSLVFEEVGEMEASKKFYEELGKQAEEINIPKNLFLSIVEYLDKGEKIMAVKMYLDETGIGLRQSKDKVDAVERFLRGESISANSPQDDITQEVKKLLGAGNVLAAVKYVHTQTGLGLKESKDFVDKLRS